MTHKVNLAAAFHDHISCTKLPSQISRNGGDIISLIDASLNNGSCIDTNNSLFGAAAGSRNEDKIQIKKLKEMILMQLDLIQHQQEQLLKKERQLSGLKHDRETLCLKIEKMENRITFLTRKLLETNSSDTIPTGIIDNTTTHYETISDLNAQSSDSEVMISCMSDTNDVSNIFTNVYSTPSPPLTTSNNNNSPTLVSPRTNTISQSVDSPKQIHSVSCYTQTSDIEESYDESKPKLTNNLCDKKVKVETSKTESKKEEINASEKKTNSKETKKSATKRKRPSTITPSSTSTSTGTTTSTISTTTTTSPSSSKNGSTVVKDDLPVTINKSDTIESTNSNEECTSSQSSSSSSSKKRRRTLSKSGNGTQSDQQQPVNSLNCKATIVNVLETDEPYDLYNCRQEKSVIQRMESSLSRDSPVRINQIEVPSWRIINLPDSNSTDGIESLDDDTFLKRHQKLENDERRRKRWDIQRLREQKLNEKLRSGRYYYSAVNFDRPSCTVGQSKQITLDLISFFPDPKEVQFITVSDKIPVMAFGRPIPKLSPKPFILPWLKSPRQP